MAIMTRPGSSTTVRMSLNDLPRELLDAILSYLDWHPSAELCPTRPDLLSSSLACRALRASAVPLIFRTVTLALRWSDSVLMEPKLVQLDGEAEPADQWWRLAYVASESQPVKAEVR